MKSLGPIVAKAFYVGCISSLLAACSGGKTTSTEGPGGVPATPEDNQNEDPNRETTDSPSQQNTEDGSVRTQGKLLLDHPHSAITPADTNRRIPFRQGELWGYINENGSIVVAALYSQVKPCNEGYCLVTLTQGSEKSHHLIDLSGQNILTIPSEYQWMHDSLSSGLIGVCTSNTVPRTCRYLDINANIAVPFDYDAVSPFTGEYAVVHFDTGSDLCGPAAAIIDKTGTVVAGRYKSIHRLWLDHFLFGTGTGCLGAQKRWVGTPNGSRLETSIVSALGISDADNADGTPSHDMLVDRNADKSYKFVNTTTLMTAFDGSFSFATNFSEGLAAVCQESGNCGYINTNGEWVIDGLDTVSSFKYGVAAVVRKSTGPTPTNWIDRNGQQVTMPDYPGKPEIITPNLIFWAPRTPEEKPALTDRNGALLFHPDQVLR